MKKFYTTLLMIAAMAGVAVAQENVQTMTLNDIITTGQLSEFYTIENDLIGVYAPPHYPRVIFAKDANEYANRSEPTKEQYNANPKRLYDERDGFFETYEEHKEAYSTMTHGEETGTAEERNTRDKKSDDKEKKDQE